MFYFQILKSIIFTSMFGDAIPDFRHLVFFPPISRTEEAELCLHNKIIPPLPLWAQPTLWFSSNVWVHSVPRFFCYSALVRSDFNQSRWWWGSSSARGFADLTLAPSYVNIQSVGPSLVVQVTVTDLGFAREVFLHDHLLGMFSYLIKWLFLLYYIGNSC